MKTWGGGDIAPPFLSSALDVVILTAQLLYPPPPLAKLPMVSSGYEGGWAPQLVWMLWRREKCFPY
jgi:hypothetical protein